MGSEVAVFSSDQVSTLTGISLRRLRYWDKTEFFHPEYTGEHAGPFRRLYSFRDLVGLRTIGLLSARYNVSLHELRRVAQWLNEHYADPWSTLRFHVVVPDVPVTHPHRPHARIFIDDPVTGARMLVTQDKRRGAGETASPILIRMTAVAAGTRRAIKQLRRRPETDYGRVERNRYIVHNESVLAGTRVPTGAIWRFHKAGYSPEQILAEYPRLTLKDIQAAIEHEEQHRRLAS